MTNPRPQPATLQLRAPAKVNLLLRVGPADPGSGYHGLLSVFHSLNLYEEITLRIGGQPAPEADAGTGAYIAPSQDSVLTRPAPALAAGFPADLDGPGHLGLRAALLLRETYAPQAPPLQIEITKQIPLAGGMAGGSADAAGVLWGANQIWGLGLSRAQLAELGARLGADVPYALWGENCLGTGRGDRIVPLPPGPQRHWVIGLAKRGLSTPEVFRQFDRAALPPAAPRQLAELPGEFLQALEASPQQLAAALRNDLGPAALELRPELAEVMEQARKAGALQAIISGSGPSIAALCADRAGAQRVAKAWEGHPHLAGSLVLSGPGRGVHRVGD